MLRAALERADELHAALLERNGALEAAGYHAQVAVTPQSSLLFLIDEPDRRAAGSEAHTAHGRGTQRPLAGRAADAIRPPISLGILDAEPERISPSALLRPVFQDFLLSASAIIGGPAEIAYFAQSGVLYERILGRWEAGKPRRCPDSPPRSSSRLSANCCAATNSRSTRF